MMFKTFTDLFLIQALDLFLLFGALSGIALGLVLIFKSHWLIPLGRVANHWVSLRHVSVWLDRNISIEQWFYRHHRVAGIAAMSGAGYIFGYFALVFDKPTLMRDLGGVWLTPPMGGLLDALVLLALSGSAVACWVGLFLWLRPSWLRGIERRSNVWVSSRRATKVLEVPHAQLDVYVLRHTRGAGVLLLLASLGLLLLLLRSWL
jgi:hypothetical protein